MSRYGQSTFLRSSAVYGSNRQSEFSETNVTSHLRKLTVDRSAVGGVSSSLLTSQTVTPQASVTRARGGGRSDSPVAVAATATTTRPQSAQYQPSREGSSAAVYGSHYANNYNNGQTQPQNLTPTRRQQTPDRARSPNPITGEGYQQQRTGSPARNVARGAPPTIIANTNTRPQQQAMYRIADGFNSGPASRTSSIGRSSSVDSARSNINKASGLNPYNSTGNGMPAAGASTAAMARRTDSGLGGGVGMKGRTATPPKQQQPVKPSSSSAVSRSALAVDGGSASSLTGQDNTTPAAGIRTASSSSQLQRTASGVRRTLSPSAAAPLCSPQRHYAMLKNQSHFTLAQLGDAPNNSNANNRNNGSVVARGAAAVGGGSVRRNQSPARVDPATMSPAGVRTRSERFDESPFRAPSHRATNSVQGRIFGGSDVASLLMPGDTTSATANNNNSLNNTTTNSGTTTPLRTHRRMVEQPVPQEKSGLWVRTKNKDNVVYLGVKGRGVPPADGRVDESAHHSTRKVIPQPANIEAAACRVVGEEQAHKKAKGNPIPVKPYHGFVIPPFRIDKDALSAKVVAELEPEVFMEPFGTEYTHRRHFDPYDSVKTDIQHSQLAPTNSTRGHRGTALVEGRGPQEQSRDIFNLHKYSAEELGEKPRKHTLMVGPPAFVPEEVKPWVGQYKAQRMGAFNSPTNVSQLDFGTSAHVQRAAATPVRTSTPRGPRMGTYSPARNLERPF